MSHKDEHKMNAHPSAQELPLSTRLKVSTAFACVCTSSYLLINHFSLREPTLLWKSPIDDWLPFMAWTVWPYIILLFTDYFFPLMIRERALFRRTMRAYALAAAISFVFWALFPTTLPRLGFVPTGEGLSEVTYRLLISMDPPNNCFPSGHISIPTVVYWGLCQQWPRWRVPLWASFALLSLTILTTKQHYVLDLIGGVGAGALGLWLSHRWESRAQSVAREA